MQNAEKEHTDTCGASQIAVCVQYVGEPWKGMETLSKTM
jgi:hypothetical protein